MRAAAKINKDVAGMKEALLREKALRFIAGAAGQLTFENSAGPPREEVLEALNNAITAAQLALTPRRSRR